MKKRAADGVPPEDLMRHPGHLMRRAVQVMNLLWDEEVSHTITSPQFAALNALYTEPKLDLVPMALKAVAKGGIVVCGGIHMSDLPSFPYELLWEERSICSVANLTRRDGQEFFAIAPRVPVRTTVETFPLAEANEALNRLRHGKIHGAAVLLPEA